MNLRTNRLGLVLALLASCGMEEEAGGRASQTPLSTVSDGSQDTEAALDELAAVGYADYSEETSSEVGVVRFDEALSAPGYDMVVSVPLATAVLMDSSGRALQSWSGESDSHWARVELLPDGDVIVCSALSREYFKDADGKRQTKPGVIGFVERRRWTGERVWRTDVTAHHDVDVSDPELFLVLTSAQRDVPEYIPGTLRDNLVGMLTASGEVLSERSLLDALIAGPAPVRLLMPLKQPIADPLHANAVAWVDCPDLAGTHPAYSPKNIIVTMRHQNLVAIIDTEQWQTVWSWGRDHVELPHEASVLPNGNVLIFDNGSQQRGYSRVVEVDPRSKNEVWEWKATPPESFFVKSRGTAQSLPNGNVLLSNSSAGEAIEVTRGGEIVWHFLSPHLNEDGKRAALRIRRYPREFVDGILASRDPGDSR